MDVDGGEVPDVGETEAGEVGAVGFVEPDGLLEVDCAEDDIEAADDGGGEYCNEAAVFFEEFFHDLDYTIWVLVGDFLGSFGVFLGFWAVRLAYLCYNGASRGLAQLVARRVWDAEVVRSSRITPTMVYMTTFLGRFCSVGNWLKPHVKNA